MTLAKRTKHIEKSAIRQVFESVDDWDSTINLALGQPDFDTPDAIKAKGVDAIQKGLASNYAENAGLPKLRQVIAENIDIDCNSSQIVITSGASEGLHLAAQTHVDPGGEVLVPDPGFVSFRRVTRIAGGITIPIPVDEKLHVTPEAVEEAASSDTDAMIIGSPANPTGAVQTKSEMQAFSELAQEYDFTLICDEVYHSIVYEPAFYSAAESGLDNVVVVRSLSKQFAMPGWRVGYIIANQPSINKMSAMHGFIEACANVPAQHAAIEAIRRTHPEEQAMKEEYENRRDVLLEGFEKLGIECKPPEGAFYAFPKVPANFVQDAIDAGVLIVPGQGFGKGGRGHARVSYCNSMESIRAGIEIMDQIL